MTNQVGTRTRDMTDNLRSQVPSFDERELHLIGLSCSA